MDYFIMILVAIIFSAGIYVFFPAPATFRLHEARALGYTFIREKLSETAGITKKHFTGFRKTRRTELVRRELYTALSILRNHGTIVEVDENTAGAAVTTDYLLEQFAQTEGILSKAYTGALRLLRTGRSVEAADYFAAVADDPLARDFINLVLDWDAVSPHKLKQAIIAFQSSLKETRTTELMRKNEVFSDIVYLPVVAGVLIVFVNFIYIAYFAEQRALLAELFF